jgi:anti-sigma regulatory factor (Ser/Thr protein kinase)
MEPESGGQRPGYGLAALEPGHRALMGQGVPDCAVLASGFAWQGIAAGEPVSVAVCPALGRELRRQLGGQRQVSFLDMAELGRNPARIIAAMLEFAGQHPGARLRYISEPVWAGRPPAEQAEAARHEALVDQALAGVSAAVLCVYRTAGLEPPAVSCGWQAHRVLIADGRQRASPSFAGEGVIPVPYDQPLPAPPADALCLQYRADLRPVRAAVSGGARAARLADGRASDLVLAVSEVAANTLRYATGGGTLHIWRANDGLTCQVSDSGTISDPLAGRRRPASDASGHGLWLVNQVCDLAELRSGPAGTTVRMHVWR